ncbi:MAG TPA: zinc ribbon domain-containing protein [Ktedonobacterales bacterium]|nr:zinc ribbon domain-containing protein [Ktedonobacterales bacterium]
MGWRLVPEFYPAVTILEMQAVLSHLEVIPVNTQVNAAVVKPSQQLHSPHQYSIWFLSLLCLGMLFYEIVVWGFNSPSPGVLFGIGMVIWLGVVVGILAVDWRHFLTMHGHIDWKALPWWGRIAIAFVYVGLVVLVLSLPVLYLAFAVKDTVDQARNRAPASKLKTAELEASLGYIPATEGECPRCHKPLQVGAEFCAYCGAAPARKPRICGKCANIAPPDANVCPKCGTLFEPLGAKP